METLLWLSHGLTEKKHDVCGREPNSCLRGRAGLWLQTGLRASVTPQRSEFPPQGAECTCPAPAPSRCRHTVNNVRISSPVSSYLAENTTRLHYVLATMKIRVLSCVTTPCSLVGRGNFHGQDVCVAPNADDQFIRLHGVMTEGSELLMWWSYSVCTNKCSYNNWEQSVVATAFTPVA